MKGTKMKGTKMTGTKGIFLALLAVLLSPMAANAVPTTIADLGELDGDTSVGSFVPANQVHWISFIANSFTYLDINASGTVDTEIGLYDAAGNRVANDDDDGIGFNSVLSFGTGSGLGLGDPFNLGGNGIAEGEDGLLGSGLYYLAFGEFNVIFNDTNFDVISTGTDRGGDFLIQIYTDSTVSSVPEPGTLALLGLGLVGMAARRRKKV